MMRRIGRLVCRSLYVIGFWRCLLQIERRCGWRRHAVVLLYHHIRSDDETKAPLSLVEEGVSESALNDQLAAFRRWYKASTAAELASALVNNLQLPEDAVVVTFDDGYRDNRTLAGPILREHQLKGLIFIATDFIESESRFWWVELNDIVRSFTPATLAACSRSYESLAFSQINEATDLTSDVSRRHLRARIAQQLDVLPLEQLKVQMELLAEAAGRPSATSLPLLSWREMSDMASGEFEFGAHTVSHPHLTRLDRKAQVQEIGRSAGCLEKHLGRRPKAFAYPHGDVDQIVESAVIDAGFESAYAAHPGTATPGRTNPFRIPRIQLDASDPAVLEVVIAIIKLSKYMPRLARPVLSRFFGAPFEI